MSLTFWALQSRDRALAAARNDVARVADAGAGAMESLFGVVDLFLRRLSEATADGDLSGPGIDRVCPVLICADGRKPSPSMLMVFAQADGDVFVREPDEPRMSLVDRDYFRAQREEDSGLYVGAPRRSPVVEGVFLPMSRRLASPEGNFTGIVAAAINLDLFQAMFQGLGGAGVARLVLRAADGRVLVDWRAPGAADASGTGGAGEEAACAPSFAEPAPDRMTAWRKLRVGGLSVGTCRATAGALRPWGRQVLVAAGAGALLLLAPVLAYPAGSRYLRRHEGWQGPTAGHSDFQFIIAARPDGRFVLEALTFGRAGEGSPGAASLVGRTARELFSAENADLVEADYRAVLASGKTRRIERRIRIDGAEFVWSTVLVPLREPGGRRAYIYGAVTDMTGNHGLERRLLGFMESALRREDEERRRIARELHDTTGQNLIAAGYELGVVERGFGDGPPRLRAALAQARALLDASVAELRTLSYVLHPPLLDEAGLALALRMLADGFQSRSGIAVALVLDPGMADRRWSPEIELALYRVAQEALTNVQRHAAAKEARIALRRTETGRLELVIEDGATGAAATPVAEGAGIRGMRDRLEALGGTLSVTPREGGMRVAATVPARMAVGTA
ncbi:histidine kinase [Methylobacterium sp. ID0610]|uniref:histidine kinase n=1 Tax=Methylobacterium carpenticola TaxID=3344827 RepID=UPI00368415F1